jgi:hypothetical protein
VLAVPLECPDLRLSLLGVDRPVQDLLEVALTNRPELAAQQALVRASVEQLRPSQAR